ncbi:isoprenylcysteine carboxylmethyltransferase family protein [Halieaceae bacterium IMCC14734]|uniref:Isoprenylcysteine carboxylmethyltransferase family protein n=1 Tax=Candidatus Litorirhabdus singularis TaxID=2518993 RepID=A0ABT3TK59_9GAMM|nr:isoprenylcysteine carboxylmethyltransferase family protein [Candidatus Litorirhabdus singularis]MCX2982687.1 isoprenylcysteine carboxylmethyltransferase family protein [Candidatus Litorirhabdus singularis]
MNESVIIIIIHQLVYQGMFFAKNFILRRRLGRPIRGTNKEASIFIGFFLIFLGLTFFEAFQIDGGIASSSTWDIAAYSLGMILMCASVLIARASLKDLGDSWRVGVIEDQRTTLIETGIYGISRNPYFVAYLLLFAAYTVFLQSLLLLILSGIGFGLIHRLVRNEENYLSKQHGDTYQKYKKDVHRYL